MRLNEANFEKYLEMYNQDKTSKVFAPLADIYRKMGMLEESIKILQAGLKFHKDYSLGYLNLAHCYVDLGKNREAFELLSQIIHKNLDSFALLKLYSSLGLKLGQYENIKFYLDQLSFLAPKSFEVQDLHLQLEEKLKEGEIPIKNKSLDHEKGLLEEDADNWDTFSVYADGDEELKTTKNKAEIYKNFLKKIQTHTFSS